MEVKQEDMLEVVNFIEQMQPVIKKAEAADVLVDQISKLAPETADLLIKSGHVAQESREVAISNLQNPAKLHECIRKLASVVMSKAAAPAPMGGPATPINSSEPEKTMKESDRVFYRGIGLL